VTGDGGGKVPAVSFAGRARVAPRVIHWFGLPYRLPGLSVRRAEINRSPGALYLDAQGRLIGVVALDIAGGEIRGISSIVNPDKLTHLGPVGDFAALVRSVR
jgi:hypothetical protein